MVCSVSISKFSRSLFNVFSFCKFFLNYNVYLITLIVLNTSTTLKTLFFFLWYGRFKTTKPQFVKTTKAIQRLEFHASYPNCLNSFIETNRSEWLNLTQINKLECRLHSEKRFLLFSILSMRQSRYPLTTCTCSWYQLIQWGLIRFWSSNIQTIQGSIFGNFTSDVYFALVLLWD